ncbi:MAG: TonB-dependent receptor plug domain-containing protein [Cyclobacteriaceae bacterium]|nr:TonB-dependent receptor plug domain-containing protein [Cyclobacteriaceae bacterium]
MKFRHSVLPIFFLLFAFSSEEPLEKILAGFNHYLDNSPQEKVYLHFDRHYFASGEDAWFKAYLVAGPLHQPSPLSRTLYVDLYNVDKRLVKQLTLQVESGFSAANLNLPDTLSSGKYLVQAYTKWMKEMSADYLFRKEIVIWNSNPVIKNTEDKEMDVQFFPEGGDWVVGIKSKIAFKAIGSDGLGKPISGEIIDNDGNVITKIQSNTLGMGLCSIVPQKNKTYRARITGSHEVSLPAAKESGVTLTVNYVADKEALVARIQSTEANKTILVIAQTRGVVSYAAKIKIPNTLSFVSIPLTTMQTGVAQITVMDENGVPLCERLSFVDRGNGLSIKMEADKQIYKPFEKINLSIEVKDAEGYPVMGNFSLAVSDDQYVPIDRRHTNISSYLYLTSELKGNIESPGYYFDKKNTDRLEALDVLMLTQGWRKFSAHDALIGKLPTPASPPEMGIRISGTLLDKTTRKPVAEGKVSFLNVAAGQVMTATTNDAGRFSFEDVIYYKASGIVLKGETKRRNTNVQIVMDSVVGLSLPDEQISKLRGSLNHFERQFIRQLPVQNRVDGSGNPEKSTLLEPINVKGKKEEVAESPNRVYGRSSNNIKVAGNPNLEKLLHPLQIIQGRVPGVSIYGQDPNWTIRIQGINSMQSGLDPMILINNVQSSISALGDLSVLNIESIDIWKGPETAMFGNRGANGVIGFNLKTSQNNPVVKDGVFPLINTGYFTSKEFYSPKYETQLSQQEKDRRSTIFWAPVVRTDPTGKASVSFYNPGTETSVTGTIEGISLTGNPGFSDFTYSIKK